MGDIVECTEPLGVFYYNSLFHGENLVFIAGGCLSNNGQVLNYQVNGTNDKYLDVIAIKTFFKKLGIVNEEFYITDS